MDLVFFVLIVLIEWGKNDNPVQAEPIVEIIKIVAELAGLYWIGCHLNVNTKDIITRAHIQMITKILHAYNSFLRCSLIFSP